MANQPYDNSFLSNEIEDQFESHLNLQQFCTIDRTLEGRAGTKRVINVYTATNGTEKLAMGKGNTKAIEVAHTTKEFEILLAQNAFYYYDEEEMKDPNIVLTGTKHAGTDMFNTVNADIYAAFASTNLSHTAATPGFDAFVDTLALLDLGEREDIKTFGFVSPADMAKIRKALKDELKYVEAFARHGYVGTVAGANLYLKQNATPGEIIVGTKEAVTMFLKKGTEVEYYHKGNRSKEEANIRRNSLFSRKYYLPALTDGTKAAKLILGE